LAATGWLYKNKKNSAGRPWSTPGSTTGVRLVRLLPIALILAVRLRGGRHLARA